MPIKACCLAGLIFWLAACSSNGDRELLSPCGPMTSLVEEHDCGEAKPVNPFAAIVVD